MDVNDYSGKERKILRRRDRLLRRIRRRTPPVFPWALTGSGRATAAQPEEEREPEKEDE